MGAGPLGAPGLVRVGDPQDPLQPILSLTSSESSSSPYFETKVKFDSPSGPEFGGPFSAHSCPTPRPLTPQGRYLTNQGTYCLKLPSKPRGRMHFSKSPFATALEREAFAIGLGSDIV
jgi:hypothetical protein